MSELGEGGLRRWNWSSVFRMMITEPDGEFVRYDDVKDYLLKGFVDAGGLLEPSTSHVDESVALEPDVLEAIEGLLRLDQAFGYPTRDEWMAVTKNLRAFLQTAKDRKA